MVKGVIRSVTIALRWIFPRGVRMVILSPLTIPFSLASWGESSQKWDSNISASQGR
jgi:hypothetical protein